tara:strand:- start:1175 stop:1393 length:219 start_codon:yes stop_codon:yes gene_type:complete
MEIENITMVELSLLITSIIGALVLFLKQLQQSKCNKIKCLCFECERSPEFKTENIDIENQNDIPNTENINRP